ncbi:hypothetical protein [Phaeovulum sp.]|uniref:hypothetical protein n=1 Tax=Phaeovulum sp. TaxID=2934796 RepID=UPI0039E6F549
MTPRIDALLARLHDMQDELEAAFDERRAALRYRVEKGRVIFEEGVQEAHRAARIRLWVFLRRTRILVALTAPVIYSLIIPFVLLDISLIVYQAICFPVYRIPKVRRRDYIVIDRQQLGYLNGVQKLNCVYCGYGNGLLAYAREVAARTEQYWCPIKHAARVTGVHEHYPNFADYGDAEGYLTRQEALRAALRKTADTAN